MKRLRISRLNLPGFYNHNYLILQTPDYVVVQVEMIHEARIIPLDGRSHLEPAVRQWLGDPRGHWEGDTLVVESTNFTPKAEQRPNFFGIIFRCFQPAETWAWSNVSPEPTLTQSTTGSRSPTRPLIPVPGLPRFR